MTNRTARLFTNGGSQVSFYATSRDAVPEALAALDRFALAVAPAGRVTLATDAGRR